MNTLNIVQEVLNGSSEEYEIQLNTTRFIQIN